MDFLSFMKSFKLQSYDVFLSRPSLGSRLGWREISTGGTTPMPDSAMARAESGARASGLAGLHHSRLSTRSSYQLYSFSGDRRFCYSGFHFLCSKLWTVADASSFALKLCRMLEKICRGVPSSPISKRIKKGSSFPRKSAQFISPICGGNFGVLQRHKSTVYSRSFDLSRSTDGVQ